MITLKGMTWSHPRGYDPLVACSARWQAETGITVEWDKRSLQDFESFPVEELARAYDLIVIDHPHVGQITKEGCLHPLDGAGRETELDALAAGSVGQSFPSYFYQGHQWAFPIDAATQVQATRPDRLVTAPRTWDEIKALAQAGRILLPLRPPHSLMSFFTLAGNIGVACNNQPEGDLISVEDGTRVYTLLADVARLVDPACYDMDPIAAFEVLAEGDNAYACVPLAYGYINYAQPGFRKNVLAFSDIPAAGSLRSIGSALGGTGIAVSAFGTNVAEAVKFAYWIASGEVQKGLYGHSNGQAGHAQAWEDDTLNAASGDFYRATRATLESAWLRPRHDGYMDFQQAASDRLNAGLKGNEDAQGVIRDLNSLYHESFAG
ncbi:extracellular solute-binding protein [Rhizobium sp. CFBP 8762]|uniref:extracellular solute-binding protein n=1 Tax=Rhizobium sp. CFBP 8762 TaxID=2775279 RepID=UPI00177E60C6|nr:extracellular solute-binding protein [Rhizobium sp. CFBP 8762]MBD8553736.1 extracellular solute-binding protein [Rhizobium sp. CFBP 8762]